MNVSGRGNTLRNRKLTTPPLEKSKRPDVVLAGDRQTSPLSTNDDEILSIILSNTSVTEISQMSLAMGRESVKKDEGRIKKIIIRTLSSILMVSYKILVVYPKFHVVLTEFRPKFRLEFL
jgi:hypothetical protein